LRKQIFDHDGNDPFKQAAGNRDGALSILVGIAARNSIDIGVPIKIGSLTSIQPGAEKQH